MPPGAVNRVGDVFGSDSGSTGTPSSPARSGSTNAPQQFAGIAARCSGVICSAVTQSRAAGWAAPPLEVEPAPDAAPDLPWLRVLAPPPLLITTHGDVVARAAAGFSVHCQLPLASALQVHCPCPWADVCANARDSGRDISTPAEMIREMLEHKRLFRNCIVAG